MIDFSISRLELLQVMMATVKRSMWWLKLSHYEPLVKHLSC